MPVDSGGCMLISFGKFEKNDPQIGRYIYICDFNGFQNPPWLNSTRDFNQRCWVGKILDGFRGLNSSGFGAGGHKVKSDWNTSGKRHKEKWRWKNIAHPKKWNLRRNILKLLNFAHLRKNIAHPKKWNLRRNILKLLNFAHLRKKHCPPQKMELEKKYTKITKLCTS